MNVNVLDRFWAKVNCNGPVVQGLPDRCWLWTASTAQGYGRFGHWDDPTRTQLAHRLAYQMIVSPVHKDLSIDHLCDTRACVNPEHMEVVPQVVNLLRGQTLPGLNLRKTHCPVGHELAGENLYLYRGQRGCKACRRQQWLAWKERQAA